MHESKVDDINNKKVNKNILLNWICATKENNSYSLLLYESVWKRDYTLYMQKKNILILNRIQTKIDPHEKYTIWMSL